MFFLRISIIYTPHRFVSLLAQHGYDTICSIYCQQSKLYFDIKIQIVRVFIKVPRRGQQLCFLCIPVMENHKRNTKNRDIKSISVFCTRPEADVRHFRFVVFYGSLFLCKALAEVRSIYGVIAGFLMSYLDFIQCAAVALSVMQTFAYIAFHASVIHLRHLLAIVLSSSLPKNIRAHLKYSPVIQLFFINFY